MNEAKHRNPRQMTTRVIKKACAVAALVLAAVSVEGCAMYQARFSPPVKQETNVVLKENDFSIVERNLSGDYSYWSLQIGFYPWAALDIPLDDPRLFSNALADMYTDSKNMAENRSTQMVNWGLDYNGWWLPIPFVTPLRRSVTFRADLLEFQK